MADNATRRLNTTEAAAYVGLRPATLERWRVVGGGPVFLKIGIGPGARVVYEISDIDDFLTSCRRRSTSDRSPIPAPISEIPSVR